MYIYRADAATGKNWTPGTYDRICSDDFIDGKPTAVNPYPTINLGHRGMVFLLNCYIKKKYIKKRIKLAHEHIGKQ